MTDNYNKHMLVESAVKKAQRILIENPFDAAHGFDHHERVWQNCEWIIQEENIQEIDKGALKVAAWWHDVNRGSVSHRELKKVLEENGAKSGFIEIITKIVDEHTFGAMQTSVESEILYDADKLEYVATERVLEALDAVKRGELSRQSIEDYNKAWKKRLPEVQKKFHYESARISFKRELSKLKELTSERFDLQRFLEGMV